MIGSHKVLGSRYRPWSTLHHLKTDAGTEFFLKVAGAGAVREAHVLRALAPYATVPVVVADHPGEGAVLLARYRGRPPRSQEVRPRILSMSAAWEQVSIRDSSMLDRLEEVDEITDFCRFQRALERCAPERWRAEMQAAEQAEAQAWALRVIDRCRPEILSSLQAAQEYPRVLIHGDLHLGNAACDRAGHLLVYDWADAAAGPPGSAFALLFTADEIRLPVLAEPDTPASPTFKAALDAYVAAHAPPTAVAHPLALVGAVLSGLFRSLLYLEAIADRSPAFLSFRSAVALQSALNVAQLATRLS